MSDEAADAFLIFGIAVGTALIVAALSLAPGFADRCLEAGGQPKAIPSDFFTEVHVCVAADGRLMDLS